MVLHFFDQLQAGHFRHDHVGDQNIHALVLDLFQRLQPVRGRDNIHRRAKLGKSACQCRCSGRVIVHDQDAYLLNGGGWVGFHMLPFSADSRQSNDRDGSKKVGKSWETKNPPQAKLEAGSYPYEIGDTEG
jgi:hypothetical protein